MIKPKSLKVRVLINLILFVSIAWIITLGLGFSSTERTLNEQLDAQLEQVAHSLSETVVTRETTQVNRSGSENQLQHERIEVQITHSEQGFLSGPSQNRNMDNPKWRFFSAGNRDSNVSVGENLDMRSKLMQNMLWDSFWPMIVALPLIAMIIWFSVTNGLAPLSTLASAIKKRSPEQLNKINIGNVPAEVVPVVNSLNELFEVVEGALNREKEFTDNAAHELRTPLASIKTHAQVALKSVDQQERLESIAAINASVDHASHLVNQLLILARLDPEHLKISFSEVNLNSIATQVIAKLTPAALAKEIDLGILESDSGTVSGDKTYLEIMISNLVDNAIRYTPKKGVINVRIKKMNDCITLLIEDSGPGIRPEDHARIFDRFVRLVGNDSEGCGIGLAIVKKIVQLHHASIELESKKINTGLVAKVAFKCAKFS